MQVTPLQAVRLAELEPVLDEELGWWKKQLYWDYDSAAKLIKRHLSVCALPGFALRNGSGRIIGYGYCLVDLHVGYVGNVYVRNEDAQEENYERIIAAIIGRLRENPRVRRIEGQLFPFNFDFRRSFQRAGLQLMERRYMSFALDSYGESRDSQIKGYELETWQGRFLGEAAKLIFAGYQDSPDQHLCADYQSARGCQRFLSNLIAGPGCGQFDKARSWVMLTRQKDVAAILLTTRIAEDTVMIPQISVLPKYQRRGLGTFLLKRSMTHFSPPIRRVALSVSCQNQGALRLYERLGFRNSKDFIGVVDEL